MMGISEKTGNERFIPDGWFLNGDTMMETKNGKMLVEKIRTLVRDELLGGIDIMEYDDVWNDIADGIRKLLGIDDDENNAIGDVVGESVDWLRFVDGVADDIVRQLVDTNRIPFPDEPDDVHGVHHGA